MSTRDLLIEIGTEELPPKALKRLSDAFENGIVEGLKNADLNFEEYTSYASPRRLAILVSSLDEQQADKTIERRGPAITAAFDDEGCPTKAAEGFARSCGVDVEQLDKLENEQGSWLVFQMEQKGETTSSLVPDIVRNALDRLPIPKRMRWGSLKEQFVRPVHWAVLLFGDEVIDTEIMAVKSGRDTRGHRFHHPETITIGEPKSYSAQLETEGHVVASFDVRREAVRGQILEIAKSVNGNAVIDEDLLDEVTSMVEWPKAILGNFEKRFLEVPSEALISAMKGHQKYFHLVDDAGKLMPHFITISNIESRDPDVVRDGNERVIRPRLSDAEFFWTQDRKQKLDAHVERLKTVVFQKKLGTLFEKTERVVQLSGLIAESLGGDRKLAERAALLSKCDLMSEMVYEFPELQGIMGRYYAKHDGEAEEVASAIDEHYMPRFAGDDLPQSRSGQAVSIADKLDTLVGIFGIGQAPTGDKDPFALRRAALGVLRIIIEPGLVLDLPKLLHSAVEIYNQQNNQSIIPADAAVQVFEFILGRLQVYYGNQGLEHDEIDAVICLKPADLTDLDKRLRAVSAFRKLPEAESLAAANKRISNILKKTEDKIPGEVNAAQLQEAEEKSLAEQVSALQSSLEKDFASQDYESAMKQLAGLRDNVDKFFDSVMVMVDDLQLRANRLALLKGMRDLFLKVADLSKLQ